MVNLLYYSKKKVILELPTVQCQLKCSVCLATITVLPYFVQCSRVYNAQTILTCLSHWVRAGHYTDGKGVCPSWWLQWCWYRNSRHILGLVDSLVEGQLSQLSNLSFPQVCTINSNI